MKKKINKWEMGLEITKLQTQPKLSCHYSDNKCWFVVIDKLTGLNVEPVNAVKTFKSENIQRLCQNYDMTAYINRIKEKNGTGKRKIQTWVGHVRNGIQCPYFPHNCPTCQKTVVYRAT